MNKAKNLKLPPIIKSILLIGSAITIAILIAFAIFSFTNAYLSHSTQEIQTICQEEIQRYCPINSAPQSKFGNCLYANRENLGSSCRFYLESNMIKRPFFSQLLAAPKHLTKSLLQLIFVALIFFCFNYYKKIRGNLDLNNLTSDMNYFLINGVITRSISSIASLFVIYLFLKISSISNLDFYQITSKLIPKNNILEFLYYLIIMDFLGYLIHRIQHSKFLWPFHSTHHSSENLDWHSNFRFHPVDYFFQSLVINLCLSFLGFKVLQLAVFFQFKIFFDCFVHSKSKADFGIFKYIFVSPTFHQHHHLILKADQKYSNFSGMFSFWDIIFKTHNLNKINGHFGYIAKREK